MKLKCILIVACSLFTLTGQADEGMWMLGNLNKQTRNSSPLARNPTSGSMM